MLALPPNLVRRADTIEGIFDFASSRNDWNVIVADSKVDLWPLRGPQSFATPLEGVTGMILWPDSVNEAGDGFSLRWVAGRPFPCVMIQDLFGWLACPAVAADVSLPRVRVDLDRLAARAVSHLQGVSVSELALVTTAKNDPLWPKLEKIAQEQGCHVERWDVSNKRLPKWLAERTDTGILASCDRVALRLRKIARESDVRIPDQVRIVSAQDSWECSLPMHSITAVRHPFREMGYQAARLLRRLIEKKPTPSAGVDVAAEEVSVRQTCAAAVSHPTISQAVQFIRAHALRGICVADVLELQDVSRVTFERRFRETMNCSPAEMIRQVRADHAKKLLETTKQSVASVAEACGFESLASFSTFFKTVVGVSPRRYRAEHGGPPRDPNPS